MSKKEKREFVFSPHPIQDVVTVSHSGGKKRTSSCPYFSLTFTSLCLLFLLVRVRRCWSPPIPLHSSPSFALSFLSLIHPHLFVIHEFFFSSSLTQGVDV